jgi:hypothetical protein
LRKFDLMADLFSKPINTKSHRVRQADAKTVARFITATKRKLPRNQNFWWHHRFLMDIRRQLTGGIRLNLTPAQVSNLFLCADYAGTNFETFEEGKDHGI